MRAFLRRSLRLKIIAWSFIPTAIILTAVAVVTYFAYQRVTEDLLVERDQELARLKAAELATSLGEYPGVLAVVARDREVAQAGGAGQQAGLVRLANRLVFFDGGVYIANNLGRVVATYPERADVMGLDWSNRPYFRPLIQSTSAPAFSDIVPDGPGGSDIIAIGVPITSADGEFLGALIGMFRVGADTISPFYGTLLKLRLERNGLAYVIDGQGRLIYASDPRAIGTPFTGHPLETEILSGRVGAVRTQNRDGQDILASYGPVPGTAWRLMIEEDWQALTEPSQGYGQFLLLLLGLGVVVPALVVLIGVRRITGPIAELVEAARQMASGNFGQAVQARTGDELEDLAQQFNRMAAELRESYTTLEQRVEARTRELATLLDITRNVSSTLQLEPLLGLILEQLRAAIDYAGAVVLTLDDGVFVARAYRGPAPVAAALQIRFSAADDLFSRQMLADHRPVRVPDVRVPGNPTWRHHERFTGPLHYVRAWMGVPLLFNEQVVGMLALHHQAVAGFSQAQAELALEFGRQVAIAIQNARLFETEKREAERTRELTTLLKVARDVTSTRALGPLLDIILDQLKDVVAYSGAAVLTVEDERLGFRAYRGPDLAASVVQARFPLAGGLGHQVIASRQPVRVADVKTEPPAANTSGARLRDAVPYMRAFLGVPLIVKEQATGLLALFHDQPGYFDEGDAALAMAFAAQAAVAIENARLFEAERRRAEQFRVIGEVGRRITSILAVEELLSQTVRLIQDTFGYYHVHVGLLEKDRVTYTAAAGVWRDAATCERCVERRLRIGEEGIAGRVAATGEPLLVPDVSADPRYTAIEPGQTGSALALPLKVKGQVIGVLNVESEQLNAFDQSDLSVLQSLANQAAVAIENARLFEAEGRRVEQFRFLSEAGQRLTSILDLNELLRQTAGLIAATFDYYHVGLGLVEGDRVIYRAGAGRLWDQGGNAHYAPLGMRVGREGITGWVAATGQPLIVPDVERDPRYLRMDGSRTRSEMALPIMAQGRVIGVVDVQSDELASFDESDLAVLRSLANLLAVALENARLYEQAGQLAALEERQKLARELHDSVSQALYGIALGARTARTLLDRGAAAPAGLRDPLDYVLALAEAGLAEMRALIFELRPESLKTEGLVVALTKQSDSLRVRHRLDVRAQFGAEPALSLDAKEALYRIAQEAMHNVAKHARANRVMIQLEDDGAGVRLTVHDNGVGFDPAGEFPGHLGLRSMRERAERLGGTFGVASEAGAGTRLTAWLPLGAPPAE